MARLFKQFSFPGGIPSHVAAETPGSIHEGGELGYALSHAFGAVFDNPDLLVACIVGDGEAETGPLATGWHSNKFLNPALDGAVLPILHLNGYKIAGPTVLARIPHDELEALFHGYGYAPLFVEGEQPEAMHQAMAVALDQAVAAIQAIQQRARRRLRRTAALADDRAALAEGLDRAEGRRRQGHRRHVALAPGADGRHGPERAHRVAVELDARLPAARAVRRQRPAGQ
jgi:phosphoketolase